MTYQKPEIWTEVKGEYGTSWRTSWEEAEAIYPELIKHLEKKQYVKGEYYDDGAKYYYKVKPYQGGWTIWRYEKKRGGSNRSDGFNKTRQQTQTTQQTTLTDNEVSFQEEVIKWMQKIDYKVGRLLAENNIDPAGIKPASSLKNDQGNEVGGDNASGLGMDIMNAVEEVTDDGLPEVQTPSGVPEIDSIAGQEQD